MEGGSSDSGDSANSNPGNEEKDLVEEECLVKNRECAAQTCTTASQRSGAPNSELWASLQKELAELKAFKAATIAKGGRMCGGSFAGRGNPD